MTNVVDLISIIRSFFMVYDIRVSPLPPKFFRRINLSTTNVVHVQRENQEMRFNLH